MDAERYGALELVPLISCILCVANRRLMTPTPPHDGHVLAVHALLQLRVEQPNTL